MTDSKNARKAMLEEIENRPHMGDKKSHSETSLQQFGERAEESSSDNAKDPGVLNSSMVAQPEEEEIPERRRTMSQPGPGSGSLMTAGANRRRRPPRSVMYAPDLERPESAERVPKLFLGNRDDYYITPTPITGSPNPFTYPNGNYKNGDVKSLSSYRLNTPVGIVTPRKRSITTMDAQSFRSIETHSPSPTSPEDNKRLSMKYLSLILSCMYAVLLVTLGLIIYPADPFMDSIPSPIYSIVLLSIGFLYQVYLIMDISRYKSLISKNQKIKSLHSEKMEEFFRKQEEELQVSGFGERTPESIRSQAVPPAELIQHTHDYCFSTGRHSGSFFLKIGAAGFALGHLIHSILLITVQISFLTDTDTDNQECIDIVQVVMDFCQPLYCFLQLYFIFKYSNVLILKSQSLAHFGFMHMIGSSLCFWISTIIRETVLALSIYAKSKYGNNTDVSEPEINEYMMQHCVNLSTISIISMVIGTYVFKGFLAAFRHFLERDPSKSAVARHIDIFDHITNIDISDLYNPNCQGPETITRIIENISPYLYPFGVEFNILIVAVYYIIWSNIGQCSNEDSDNNSSLDDNTTVCKIPTADEENDYTSNMVIYADCHASNKGMFLGLILTVVVVGMLILGFIFSTIDQDFIEKGYLLNSCTKLGLHTVLLFAVVVAFNQTRKLDINEHPVSLLDDILLFICLPAFFMETVFSLYATIHILNIIKSIDIVVMVIQVVVQTALLVDGLRRCSNGRKLRRTKPGREVLIFLVIANVAMWLIYTFSYKSPDSLDERYEFYGKVLWSILGHVSLPLMMFYRFHSSVCFADIWDAAYKPGSSH